MVLLASHRKLRTLGFYHYMTFKVHRRKWSIIQPHCPVTHPTVTTNTLQPPPSTAASFRNLWRVWRAVWAPCPDPGPSWRNTSENILPSRVSCSVSRLLAASHHWEPICKCWDSVYIPSVTWLPIPHRLGRKSLWVSLLRFLNMAAKDKKMYLKDKLWSFLG